MENVLSLVILAAGSSTRYGLIKQTELFGPDRRTIAEYNLLYAISCGINRVVFVIKEQTANIFHKRLSMILPENCEFSLAYQPTEPDLNKFCNRTKPWGTGHALLAAKRAVQGNFGVMNADDLYGEDAIKNLVTFLKSADKSGSTFCAVGYRLAETLSANGTVSRGLMDIQDNRLRCITEHRNIQVHNSEITDENKNILDKNTLVSMNLWGFTPKIFQILENQWQKFKKNINDPVNDEFYLPYAINSAIENKICEVQILPTSSKWHGITYQNDREMLENWLKNKKIV